MMTDLMYDVFITIAIDGKEKTTVNRVKASDNYEAVQLAIEEECHNINKDDIMNMINKCKANNIDLLAYWFDDIECAYKVTSIIPLQKTIVNFIFNGKRTNKEIYLPFSSSAANYQESYYFT